MQSLLLPLCDPPYAVQAPKPLPERTDEPFGNGLGWTVSQHACPAAFPRSRQRAAQSRRAPFELTHLDLGTDKSKHKEDIQRVFRACSTPLVDIDQPESFADQEQHYLSLNRYLPPQKRKGKTLVFLQGTGFPKEVSEPVIGHLLASEAGEEVAEVWSIDFPTHGSAHILNEGKLGDAGSWLDNGRDLLNFLLRYLPPPGEGAPSFLKEQKVDSDLLRLSKRTHSSRSSKRKGGRTVWRGHQVCVSAHSMGGNFALFAAVAVPEPFDSIFLVDPITVVRSQTLWQDDWRPPVGLGLKRIDKWKSLEAAKKQLKHPKAPTSRYDPKVLELYLRFALRELPDGRAELVEPKCDECMTFGDHPEIMYSLSEQLPRLKNGFATSRLHWLRVKDEASWVPKASQEEQLAVMTGSTSEQYQVGHFVPEEEPVLVAKSLGAFLLRLKADDEGSGRAHL